MSFDTWKLSRNSDVLGQIKTFVPGIEQSKVIQKTLGGEVYVQTIGTGVKYANIDVLANREELTNINIAEADGALVSARYRGVVYYGVIEEPPQWEAIIAGYWYTTTVKLLIESELEVI